MTDTPAPVANPTAPAPVANPTAPAPVADPFADAVIADVDKLAIPKPVAPFVQTAVTDALASGVVKRLELKTEDAVKAFIKQARQHAKTLEGSPVVRAVVEDVGNVVRFTVKAKPADTTTTATATADAPAPAKAAAK